MAQPPAPGSTAALRPANQQRVLDVLRATSAGPEFTQAELARTTGLAPATVSNIVRELGAAGLVDTVPGSGRRGSRVRLALSAGLVAGIDFGHSHVAVALGDLTGTTLCQAREPIDAQANHKTGLEAAARMLGLLLGEQGATAADVHRVGMGLPAPLKDHVVRSTSILPGWVGLTARTVASDHLGLPVDVDNDANLGALAEHRRGIARGCRNSVFVKVASGVGAGLVLEDELYRGSDGTAGELGHLTVDDNGPVCRCGSRGCLEAYVSIGAIRGMTAAQLPEADFSAIVAAAADGNVSAIRAFEDVGLHLGWALATVVNVLNPEMVTIGGDVARAGDILLDSVRVGLRRHALDSAGRTPVAASTLGEGGPLTGAVLFAAQNVRLLDLA